MVQKVSDTVKLLTQDDHVTISQVFTQPAEPLLLEHPRPLQAATLAFDHPAHGAADAWRSEAAAATASHAAVPPLRMPAPASSDKRPFGSLPDAVFEAHSVVVQLCQPPSDQQAAATLQRAAQDEVNRKIEQVR